MTADSAPTRAEARRRPRRPAMARAVLVSAMAILAGCTHYQPPVVMPLAAQVRTDTVPHATQFDSLAQAVGVPPAVSPAVAFAAQGDSAVSWLGLLQDSALVRIVRVVLRDNRDLRVALARIKEFHAEVGNARSELFPELDANASASTNQIAIGGSPPISYHAFRITGDLQWEIDFWGRIRRGVAAAQADEASVAADQRALVLTLVANTADAYLDLAASRQALDIAEETLASRQNTLALARQRYAQGLISELDVRQFEGDVASAASSVAQYTRGVSVTSNALTLLMGRAPGPVPVDSAAATAVAAVAVPDSVPAAMLLRRPDVISAERQLAAEVNRTEAIRRALLPRVLVTGQYGRQSPSLGPIFDSQHEIYALQLGLSVPLFAGGRQQSEIAAAQARIAQARGRYEQTLLTALSEASSALIGVRTYRDQWAAQSAQAASLRHAFDLAERRYQGGIASYLEVLDSERALFGAEIATVQSRRFYLQAVVELYKALGGRWQSPQ